MMNRLLLTWILVAVILQLTSAVILRPKWFPYFSRHNQGGSGRVGSGHLGSAHAYHQSSRPAGTLASRQARTVGIVEMEPEDFASNQHLPVPTYLRSWIWGSSDRTSSGNSIHRGSRLSGYTKYNSFYPERDSRSNFGRDSNSNNNIPRCRSGQRSSECLDHVLKLVEKMLELE